jgi:hypothetical protein
MASSPDLERGTMRLRSKLTIPLGVCIVAMILFASSGVINVYLPNPKLVSNHSTGTINGQPNYRWEPSSAVGSLTWVHSWQEIYTATSFVASWYGSNGYAYTSVQPLTPNTGVPQNDVNLNWDPYCNRFVFASKDVNGFPNAQIWYGHSTDATGTSWVFGNNQQPIFSSGTGNWDYPSIGVDGSGRIIVGATKIISQDNCGGPGVNRCPDGYYAVATSAGSCSSEPFFSAPTAVGSPPVNSINSGAYGRVAATDYRFEAFIPTLDSTVKTPVHIARYESTNGSTWTTDSGIGMPGNGYFGAALNNGGNPNLYYAPLPAAQGYSNGLWTVAFQLNNGGWNNAAICTSDRGCGYISEANHHFLVGTSVSGDRGYWLSYYTYNGNPGGSLLKTVATYFPPGLGGIAADTNSAVYPTSWTTDQSGPRCPSTCYAAGDFNTVASNSYAGAATPFINSGVMGGPNDVFSSFPYDPQGVPNVPNYKPNFIPLPRNGPSATTLALPVPSSSWGLPPGLKVGPFPPSH